MRCVATQSPQKVAYVVATMMVVAQPTYSMSSDEKIARPVRVESQSASDVTTVHQLISSSPSHVSFDVIPDEMRFGYFAGQWKKNRNNISSFVRDLVSEPNYLSIVGMGPTAIPYILSQLRKETKTGEPDHWFAALWAIAGENPVLPEHQGKIFEMANDWIRWGEQRGL